MRRGHSVDVLADPTAEASALSAGCRFLPWRTAPRVDSIADQTALIAELESGSPAKQFAAARDRFLVGPAAAYADDVTAAVGELSPDVVLAEGAMPGILIGAIAGGRPTAALMPNIYLRPTPGMPVMASGWPPGTGPLGRARDAIALAVLRLVMRRLRPDLNAVLAAQGRRESVTCSSCSTAAPRSWS